MSTRPDPDDRIVGGRVFKELSIANLRTRANAGKSGYTVARDFLDQIDGKLTQDVRSELAEANIDALGFEIEVNATAGGSPPFAGVTGLIGISVVWFTNTSQGVTDDPQIYLFAKWGAGGVEPLRKTATPLGGCFFVVNDSGTGQSSLGPAVWESVLPNVGVGQTTTRGPLLAGTAFLVAISVQNALLYLMHRTNGDVANALFTFGTGFTVVPGEDSPFAITGSAYKHAQWLLERLEFLERPHGQTWTPPEHKFWKNAGVSIPTWSGSLGYSQPRMSLVFSTLSEEDDWIKNDNPATKFEENSGPDQLKKLEQYYKVTDTNSTLSMKTLLGREPEAEAKEARDDKSAWSAVFISYVVYQSGVRKNAGFAFSFRHITYIAHAYLNRKNKDMKKPFWLYESGEIDPKKGDILCKNRKGGGTLTFGDFKKFVKPSSGKQPYEMAQPDKDIKGRTHCDIVVRAETIKGRKFLETVGGNTYDYRAQTVDTAGRKRWMQKDNGDWVMVGADNKELGKGSSTKNVVHDPSEPDPADRNPTIWKPKVDTVFGFIRRETK